MSFDIDLEEFKKALEDDEKKRVLVWVYSALIEAYKERDVWRQRYEALASANENTVIDPFDTSDL